LWRSSSSIKLTVSLEKRLFTVPAFNTHVFIRKLSWTRTLDIISCRRGNLTWSNPDVFDGPVVSRINVSLIINVADLARWWTIDISDRLINRVWPTTDLWRGRGVHVPWSRKWRPLSIV